MRVIHHLRLVAFITLAIMATHAWPGTPEQRQPVDVYILSGQSNMVGSGRADQLPKPWQQPIEGAYIFRGGKFEALVAGKDGRSGRFGPEVGFARELLDNQASKSDIYLIKFALSGQPLDAGWDGSKWVGPDPGPERKTFYPGADKEDPDVGLHYKRLSEQIEAAMQRLTDEGYRPVLKGIVWMQGEADAKHNVSAGRYDRSLSLLKKRIEQEHGDGNSTPFVFGQVLPHEPALERFVSRELIRQRMADADWNSGTKHAIDDVWMVPTEGMELLKDTVHYSTNGQLSLGQAFGRAMLKAQNTTEESPE